MTCMILWTDTYIIGADGQCCRNPLSLLVQIRSLTESYTDGTILQKIYTLPEPIHHSLIQCHFKECVHHAKFPTDSHVAMPVQAEVRLKYPGCGVQGSRTLLFPPPKPPFPDECCCPERLFEAGKFVFLISPGSLLVGASLKT